MKKEYNGEWNLPDNKISLPGKLFIDSDLKKITLELYSKKYLTGGEIKYRQINFDNNQVFDLIIGKLSSQIITLYNCSVLKGSSIGKSLFKLTYKIDFIFFNIHLKDINNLHIHKVNIEYPYLSTFFDGWDSINDFDNKSEDTIYSKEINITKKLNIKLIDEYQKRIKNIEGEYDFKYSKMIQFEYPNGELFHKVFKDFYRFSKMLSFTTKEPICFNIKTAYISTDQILDYDKNMYPVIDNLYTSQIINYSHNKSYDINKKFLHQNFMLFSKWTFTDSELNHLIKKWFKNEKLFPIYDFYIDSNNWFKGKDIILSNVMYNNKFLNLIQGLESIYDISDIEFAQDNDEFTKNRQRALNCILDESLKKWVSKNLKFPKTPNLTHKLDFFIDKFEDVFKGIKGLELFIDQYSIKAKEYRHKLSHGDIEKTHQGEEFDKLFYFSKLILCFCILKSLGFTYDGIRKVLSQNKNLDDDLRMVLNK